MYHWPGRCALQDKLLSRDDHLCSVVPVLYYIRDLPAHKKYQEQQRLFFVVELVVDLSTLTLSRNLAAAQDLGIFPSSIILHQTQQVLLCACSSSHSAQYFQTATLIPLIIQFCVVVPYII